MPHINLSMTHNGPLVDVWLAVSAPREAALTQANLAVPAPIKIRALLDTGASCTAIDPAVITKLQVPVTGTTSILTPSTAGVAHTCNQYDVLLAILDPNGNPLYFSTSVPVIESALASQGIEGLIGRDVLGGALFIYNGTAGHFTLSY